MENSYRLPPQNIEAEQSILGGVLLDNGAFSKALEVVSSEDFYRESHRRIFDSMVELFEKNDPTDLITLTETLKRKNQLEEVGGSSYLASLADGIPTAANITYYARIVKEKAVLRKLIQTATDIVTEGYESRAEVDELLDTAEQSIFQITDSRIRPTFFDLKTILKGSFETIEKLYERKELITGVPTGFVDFDSMTSGLQPSELIVIAGRPSMGKTALCLNMARNASVNSNVSVAFFSLEMSKEQLALRLLCSEAKVDAHDLRRGRLTHADWPKLTMAAGVLSEASIAIDDSPSLSVLEMRAKARRLKAERGLGLVIVDYLQLMRGRGGVDRREQEISEISRSLKALAKELNIPVVALSQLNRRVEERTDKKPILADLRESGAIEQDADVIVFIYRDEMYKRAEEGGEAGTADIIIGKQRNGPTGQIRLAFLSSYACFENYAYGTEAS